MTLYSSFLISFKMPNFILSFSLLVYLSLYLLFLMAIF